jgi:hypothetical protein
MTTIITHCPLCGGAGVHLGNCPEKNSNKPVNSRNPFSKVPSAWASNNVHYKAQLNIKTNPAFVMDKNNKLKKLRDIVSKDKKVDVGATTAVDQRPQTKPPGHDDEDNRHLKPQQNTDAAQTLYQFHNGLNRVFSR